VNHSFNPRVVNKSDISFSEQEMSLQQKGPKCTIHTKPTNWIRNLALETETAISHLPPTDREVYRKLTAERISTLQKKNNPLHTHTHKTHTQKQGQLKTQKQN